MVRKREVLKEGFSLVEMIIAIAIMAIVMSGVLLLMSYSTNNMRKTTNMVNLQNQSKDAMMHLTTYVQEASDVYWDDDKKLLIVSKTLCNEEGNPAKIEIGQYWFDVSSHDGDGTERGDILFLKNEFPEESGLQLDDIVKDDNSIDYSKIIDNTDYEASSVSSVEGSDPIDPSVESERKKRLLVRDVVGFSCEVNDNSVSESSTPSEEEGEAETEPETEPVAGSPTKMRIGGRYLMINLKLKNELGDAEFENYKEVFLRNQ